MSESKLLLQTSKLHLFDAADLALTEAGVPHQLESYDVTGQRQLIEGEGGAGPASLWSILVPEDRMEEGQAVIDELPWDFTAKPDVWDCCDPAQQVNKRWLVYMVWALVTIVVVLLLATLRSLLFDA